MFLAGLLSGGRQTIIGHRNLFKIGHHQGHLGVCILFQHRLGMGQDKFRRAVIGGKLKIDGDREGPPKFILKFIGIALDGINLVGLQHLRQPDAIQAPLLVGGAQPGVTPTIGPGIIVRPCPGQAGRERNMVVNLFIDNRGLENQCHRPQWIAACLMFTPRLGGGSHCYPFVAVVDAFNAFKSKSRKTMKRRQDSIFHTPFRSAERHQTRLHVQRHLGVKGKLNHRRYQPDPPCGDLRVRR